MWTYYIMLGAIALVSWLVSSRLKSKFEHYSKVSLRNGMSGADITLLREHFNKALEQGFIKEFR